MESRQKKKSKHKHKRKKEKHKKEKHKKKRRRHSVASEDESRVRGATTAHQSTQHMALLVLPSALATDVLVVRDLCPLHSAGERQGRTFCSKNFRHRQSPPG